LPQTLELVQAHPKPLHDGLNRKLEPPQGAQNLPYGASANFLQSRFFNSRRP
jgi:hypothetical protein